MCMFLLPFQCREDIAKNLVQMKEVLYGTGGQDPVTEQVTQLAQEIYSVNLLEAMILNLSKIDFEVSASIYCFLYSFVNPAK